MKNIFLMLCLGLAACAFDKNDTSSSNQAQIRQNEIIFQTYGELVGTYKGALKTAAGSEEVTLIIDISSEPITNPNGTPGSRMVPIAFFSRYSKVLANYMLSPRGYIKENGDLFLTSIQTGEKGNNLQNPDDVTSIEAKVAGQKILGRVLTKAGTLGKIELTFTSKETMIPGNGIGNEYIERLKQQYKAIEGSYIGSINPGNPNEKKIPIEIILTVTEELEPTIRGFYKRLDYPGMIDLPLKVNYRPDATPPLITMSGNGGGSYVITIDGNVQNKTITASFNSLHEGYVGQVIVKKK